MGFVRQSKYIFPWILRFIFGNKQKYFWIHQKYIETLVSNPPIDAIFTSNSMLLKKWIAVGNMTVAWWVEWPMLWRITKNSLHNEGTYKWVNWAPIFFWYKLLPTTSGPQKFAKIRAVKVDYFDFPGEIFEKLVWIRC